MNMIHSLFVLLLLFAAMPVQAQEPEVQQGAPRWKEGPRGMTWVLKKKAGDLVCVGRDEKTDAYAGDTHCSASLPILAIMRKKMPKPAELTIESQYYEWSGGSVALTRPVQGFKLTSLQEANRLVQEELGPGWEMAEFHDGWGWNFWAYGNVAADQRFWVFIDDQPANPWNSRAQ